MSEKRIPLVDLGLQHAGLRREISAAIERVIDESAFTLSESVKLFEEEFAAYCNADHAVGVSSGTDALHLALRALGVGEGDEVITVPNTFVATVEAIVMTGARPVFVDIEEDSYLMDVSQLEAAVTSSTKAIIPVHLYGQQADMEAIHRVADKHGIFVVEDACQAHGSSQNGRSAGALGDAACFSFYPGKNLGAIGDGGAVVTKHAELAEKVSRLRNHGSSSKYEHEELGFCNRLDGLQASVLGVKLPHLDTWNEDRRRVAALYDEALKDMPVVRPVCRDGNTHSYHLYVIQVEDREALRSHLAEHEIQAGIHYPIPLHLQPALKEYGFKPGDFPIAERVAGRILSLPIFPGLGEPEVLRIARHVGEFLLEKVG